MRGAQSHIGKGVRLAKAEEEPTTRSFLLSQGSVQPPYFEGTWKEAQFGYYIARV